MSNELHQPQVEKLPVVENPYSNSEIVSTLLCNFNEGRSLKIAFADIDSTLTGSPDDQKAAYDALIQAGYFIVFVTSRTPEMTISSEATEKSTELKRPAPKLKKKEQSICDLTIDNVRDSGATFLTAYPDQVDSFVGIYNGYATLGSTGTENWIKQKDGSYRMDNGFELKMKINKETWRQDTIAKIDSVNEVIDSVAKFAPIEDINNYHEGKMDVAPPDLRIQMNFFSLKEQLVFMERMSREYPELRIIEDGDPIAGRFQVYITPELAGKEIAVEDFFQSVMREVNNQLPVNKQVVAGDFDTLFIGDSWPDIPMGLFSAEGSNATLLLVGGSRLTSIVGNQRSETIQFASANFTPLNNRIFPTAEKGVYQFDDRLILVGDEAYPGTKAPQTITAFLKSTK